MRCQKNGRRRDIGLGSAKKVRFADARQKAIEARCQIEAGIDPVIERRKAAGIPTFGEAAALVFAESTASWRNAKHKWQWMNSLEKFAFPALGDRAVNDIDGPAVRDVLAAIWLTKNETAMRVRQRINAILDWSVAKGYRDAPLAMSVINKSLPKLPRGHKKGHPALPFAQMPEFIAQLRDKKTIGALALEAVILCACRSNEIRLATWLEIDFDSMVWTIPAERMGKRSVEHVIPLSDAMLTIFEAARAYRVAGSDYIFQGQKKGKPLSDMAMSKLVKDMHKADLDNGGIGFFDPTMKKIATPHGFRSSFKDWAAETTSFPNELSEAALHHAIRNKSEAAYRRGSLLEKRRAMMDAWTSFCGGIAGNNVIWMAR